MPELMRPEHLKTNHPVLRAIRKLYGDDVLAVVIVGPAPSADMRVEAGVNEFHEAAISSRIASSMMDVWINCLLNLGVLKRKRSKKAQ